MAPTSGVPAQRLNTDFQRWLPIFPLPTWLGNPSLFSSFPADSSASATSRGGKEAKQQPRGEAGRVRLPSPRDAARAEGTEPHAVQGPARGRLDSGLNKSCFLCNCSLQLKAHKLSVTAKN